MRLLDPFRDKQQDKPVRYCCRCGGDIYDLEEELCDRCAELDKQEEKEKYE